MQGYVRWAGRGVREVEEVLRGAAKSGSRRKDGGLQHVELEEQLDVRGRELLRRLYQGRLDLTAARRCAGMT